MIYGLVAAGGGDGADPAVEGIFSECPGIGLGAPSEIPVNGLAHEERQARLTPGRLVLQLPISFLRKT